MGERFDMSRPIYAQIVERLKAKILAGIYPPGGHLDSVRDMAAAAGVNPNTMQRALAQLEAEGLVHTERTTGRFVTEDTALLEQLRNETACAMTAEYLEKMRRSTESMKATIIIPNINGKGWLKDSIESVYAQTEQDFELIVVDNGSTDESLEQARSYRSRPNFQLIENGSNTGFSHAVNQGIARAKSEFVVLFNNDAFAEPQWLAELIRVAESDEKIFAVQSLMIRHFDRELADDAGDYVTWMGFACKTGDGRRASRYTKQKRIFSACGGAALYRKSILDEIGVFDENFFAYFEDVDLSWRANNAGYKNVLCPTAKCYHICGASTGAVRYNAFKSQQSGRNSILLPLKNEPLLMLILNFLPLALGYLLKCYKFHKQGFGEAWDKGMREAFDLLKNDQLGKRPFRLRDLPNYVLMELWMIWNMVPYLWYRLVVVRFDLK